VSQIPRNTRKKFEIATTESANPIKQDIKDGKLREFRKVCTCR
jgi:inorganic pyrophosphatase